jgi:hypothetical protein
MAEREAEMEPGPVRDVELIVRHVIPEHVAPVVGEPELVRDRVPGEAATLRMPSAYVSSPEPSGFMRSMAATIGAGAHTLHGAHRHVEHVVRPERDELPRVSLIRIREIVADRNRPGRRVELFFDVVEAQDLAGGRHIQRTAAHRDAVGLSQTRRERDDPVVIKRR